MFLYNVITNVCQNNLNGFNDSLFPAYRVIFLKAGITTLFISSMGIMHNKLTDQDHQRKPLIWKHSCQHGAQWWVIPLLNHGDVTLRHYRNVTTLCHTVREDPGHVMQPANWWPAVWFVFRRGGDVRPTWGRALGAIRASGSGEPRTWAGRGRLRGVFCMPLPLPRRSRMGKPPESWNYSLVPWLKLSTEFKEEVSETHAWFSSSRQ